MTGLAAMVLQEAAPQIQCMPTQTQTQYQLRGWVIQLRRACTEQTLSLLCRVRDLLTLQQPKRCCMTQPNKSKRRGRQRSHWCLLMHWRGQTPDRHHHPPQQGRAGCLSRQLSEACQNRQPQSSQPFSGCALLRCSDSRTQLRVSSSRYSVAGTPQVWTLPPFACYSQQQQIYYHHIF